MSMSSAALHRASDSDEPRDSAESGDFSHDTTETTAVQSIPASALLLALSALTAVGFTRIFADTKFLGSMLFIVVSLHAFCLVLRLFKVRGYIAIPAAFAVMFTLLAWKYYPDTMSGPFPTPESWQAFLADLQLARGQFPSSVAPVAAVGGFIVLATASTAAAAILSDAFAFRAYGRVETTVPNAVLFVFASALGADRHRVAITTAWLACALAVIVALRVTHAQVEHVWIGNRSRVLARSLPVAAVLAGCAAAGAAIVGPRLPGAGETALFKPSKKNDVTQVLSPLVDIRSRLVTLSDTELFTVAAAEPNYWRATALTEFDGSTWKLPDGNLAPVDGSFAAPAPQSHNVVQQIHIAALGGNLLPAAYSAVSLQDGKAYWVDTTGTLVVPGIGLQQGSNYTVVSSITDVAASLLGTAPETLPDGDPSISLPNNFPESVTQTAFEVTAASASRYDKALALQNWFRSQFVYDLTVQRGHSDDAIENFLRVRRGFCEQFSGAFAAMARSVGIPARVAVGFTPGDAGADGRYHVYGRNAHAWPEVWFQDVGWVSFEPTPGRGQPGAEERTGVIPQQANAGDPNSATPITTPTTTPVTQPGGPTTTIANTSGGTPQTSVPTSTDSSSSSSNGPSIWLALVVLLIAAIATWAFALPRVLRRIRLARSPATSQQAIALSWQRAAHALALIGAEPRSGETFIEHAQRVGANFEIDAHSVQQLALDCTAAVYGNRGSEIRVQRAEQLSAQIVLAVKDQLDARQRLIAVFDPRMAEVLLPA